MADRRRVLLMLVALLTVFVMIAAACGDSDGDDDSGAGDDEVTAGQDEEEGDGDGDVDEDTDEDTSDVETGDGPAHGGRLVYGIEADSANPWVHYATSCAISCRMIFRAISDPLFITGPGGAIEPYLVEEVTPSEDLMTWTMTVKDGISFHDGTPLDGQAVADNVMACKLSPLTGPAYTFLDSATAEGQVVTLSYSQPDAVGPALLRDEVCGFMFSPTWMSTLASYPLLAEEEAADATGNQAEPVGLGPFRFVSYTPGNGNSFIAERNPDYWRGDGPSSVTDEGLPYLDEIEFVVAVDIQSRSSGVQSGQFDIIHTANADEISRFVDDEDFTLVQANDFGETSYVLLNVGADENPTLAGIRGVDSLPMDPGGLNADSPLLIEACRRALAHAIDLDRWSQERNAGLTEPANGPFPPGSIGYLEDTGYPAFDLAAAETEMTTCLADAGSESIEFTFNTTNDPYNVESNTLTAAMWTEAFGDRVDVSIQPIEQGQYIGLALAGTFEAQGWRNHGGVDPTEQWYWWSSATASPIDPEAGELALNFGRFQDPEIDTAFGTILTSPDPAARQAAAEEVNREFGEHVYNFWYYWTLWGTIANSQVQNITDLPLPTGGTTFPVISGKHHLSQIWCTDGDCQG